MSAVGFQVGLIAVVAFGCFGVAWVGCAAVDLRAVVRGRSQREFDLLADAYRWQDGRCIPLRFISVPRPRRVPEDVQ